MLGRRYWRSLPPGLIQIGATVEGDKQADIRRAHNMFSICTISGGEHQRTGGIMLFCGPRADDGVLHVKVTC